MHKRFPAYPVLFFLVLVLVFFTACGSRDQVEEEIPADAETTEVIPPPQTTSEPAAESGETKPDEPPANDDFALASEGIRPLAVMIDNEGSKVLPQGGLDKAQIIYEIIVEGGLTRLMPIFWGTNPEMIGPVRSARHYFLDYCMEYDAIYVHYGESPQADRDIGKFKINEIDGIILGPDVFWDLTKDPGNWQDSYTSMEKLKAYAQKRKYKSTTEVKFPFTYNQSDVIPAAGQPAPAVTLKYPSMTVKYEYDGSTGLYSRFRYGKPHMERVSGEQLKAKNIIVMFVPNYDIKGDPAGRQEMDTTGSGKGYFITGGKAVKIKWSKESRSSQTKYADEEGNPITLNRGQTWIQIMPVAAKVTFE
ncbi:MAG: DUF3048 domain-containing protein [Bacillota bacterium]